MIVATVLAIITASWLAGVATAADAVDFNREVRPILADNCFRCHGTDEKQRQAGLGLDLREKALVKLESGDTAIVPGDPPKSEVIRRVTATDDGERMPPKEMNKRRSQAAYLSLSLRFFRSRSSSLRNSSRMMVTRSLGKVRASDLCRCSLAVRVLAAAINPPWLAGTTNRRRGGTVAQVHVLAEIILSGLGMIQDFIRPSMTEHFARPDHVAAVGDLQGLANLVVGDEDGDAVVLQAANDRLDAGDRHRVDAGERFVEQDDLGVGNQRPGDLQAPPLAAG